MSISATKGLCITSIWRKLFREMHLKAHKQIQYCQQICGKTILPSLSFFSYPNYSLQFIVDLVTKKQTYMLRGFYMIFNQAAWNVIIFPVLYLLFLTFPDLNTIFFSYFLFHIFQKIQAGCLKYNFRRWITSAVLLLFLPAVFVAISAFFYAICTKLVQYWWLVFKLGWSAW